MHATEFQRIGKRLFAEHLIGGNFGNISVRDTCEGRDGFYIKSTGAFLDDFVEPVFVPLEGNVPPEASSEYRVHKAVYKTTTFSAIVHAHPPHAVAASFVFDAVEPKDSEAVMFCPKIPVVTGAPGSQEIADNVAHALKQAKVTIVRGHGTFAAGKNLEEAFIFTSLAEYSCKVLLLKEQYEKIQ